MKIKAEGLAKKDMREKGAQSVALGAWPGLIEQMLNVD